MMIDCLRYLRSVSDFQRPGVFRMREPFISWEARGWG